MKLSSLLQFPVWAPIVLFAVGWLYILLRRQLRLRERTIDEVVIFLHKFEWEEMLEIFDETRELRLIFSPPYCYRRTVRIRIHTARDFLWRMYLNIRVIEEWARTELQDLPLDFEERQERRGKHIREVLQMAAELRRFTIARLVRLTFWALLRADRWPAGHVPAVAFLRHCGAGGESDLIHLYTRLKEAAADMALVYGERFHDEILAAL